MMGVGKSTVGRSLSIKLNMRFVDLDQVIEKEEDMKIRKIFELKGEDYFRSIEKKIALKKIDSHNSVIALGGGAFVDPIIRKSVLKKTISFWLDADINEIKKRITSTKKRPLLNNKDNMKMLIEIYKKRKNIYKLANYRIECQKLDKPSIERKIIEIYEAQRNKS